MIIEKIDAFLNEENTFAVNVHRSDMERVKNNAASHGLKHEKTTYDRPSHEGGDRARLHFSGDKLKARHFLKKHYRSNAEAQEMHRDIFK